MGFNSVSMERYYGRSVEQVYQAMEKFLRYNGNGFQLRDVDDVSYTCVFSSGISLTTWGENFTASVVPSGSGAVIKLTVTGKIGATAAGFQDAHSAKISGDFFSGVSAVLGGKDVLIGTGADGHSVEQVGGEMQTSQQSSAEEDIGGLKQHKVRQFFNNHMAAVPALIIIVAVIVIIAVSISNPGENYTTANSGKTHSARTAQSEETTDSDEGDDAEDTAPERFETKLDCSSVSSDSEADSSASPFTGVNSDNYKDTSWKANTPVSCFTYVEDTYDVSNIMSATEKKAIDTAYGSDAQYTNSQLTALYELCASTAFYELSLPTLSDNQAQELKGALVLCPDHPRAQEINNRISSDMAKNADLENKRNQGLIKGDGTYKVPAEISPGTWKTMNDKLSSCYWETEDANGQIIENNFINNGIAQTITIPNSAAGFVSQGCGEWEKQ